MKRDMDLIRQFLIIGEAQPIGCGSIIQIPGYTREEIYYNAEMAHQAGLIQASFRIGGSVAIISLTNEGHNFLDEARDETRWNRAKEIAVKQFGLLTVETMKVVLTRLVFHGMST